MHRDPEEIWDGGLKSHVYSHDHELEEDRCIQREGYGTHLVQVVDRFSHVSSQGQAIHILCSKLFESVHGGAEKSALGNDKTCVEVLV